MCAGTVCICWFVGLCLLSADCTVQASLWRERWHGVCRGGKREQNNKKFVVKIVVIYFVSINNMRDDAGLVPYDENVLVYAILLKAEISACASIWWGRWQKSKTFDGGREKTHHNCNTYLQRLPLSQNSVLPAPLTRGALLDTFIY